MIEEETERAKAETSDMQEKILKFVWFHTLTDHLINQSNQNLKLPKTILEHRGSNSSRMLPENLAQTNFEEYKHMQKNPFNNLFFRRFGR